MHQSLYSSAAVLFMKCSAIDRQPGSKLCGSCEMKKKYSM